MSKEKCHILKKKCLKNIETCIAYWKKKEDAREKNRRKEKGRNGDKDDPGLKK